MINIDEIERPWPDGVEPTPGQWAMWIRDMSPEQAAAVVERVLLRQKHDTHCLMNDHVGLIEALRREVYQLQLREQQRLLHTPRIVVLCGSTRFKAEYAQANQNLTLAGEIVLSCGVWGRVNTSHTSSRPMWEDEKSAVDELHKRKIDLADHVLVIDPGGYIGDSTRSEIAYATEQGKPVGYWSRGEVICAP